MRTVVLALILCAVSVKGFSQRFQIINGYASNLKPNYARTTGSNYDTVHVRLKITGSYNDTAPNMNTARFAVEKFNLPNNPRLVNSTMFFPREVWPGNRLPVQESIDTTIILSLITDKVKDTLANDEIGHIVIDTVRNSFHTIRLTNSALKINTDYDRNKPFWIEVGANFDLIDGLEPNNFFAGVFFHRRDVRAMFFKDSVRIKRKIARLRANNDSTRAKKLEKDKFSDSRYVRSNNLGIFAGIFESKSLTNTTDQNYSIKNYYDSTSFIPNVRDSVRIYKGVGNYISKKVVKGLSFFFSPQLRLSNKSANTDGLHFFTSLWAELQWQKIEEDQEFKLLRNQDTSVIHLDLLQKYNAVSSKKEMDVRSHYFGIGFPIYFRETAKNDELVQLLINPVVGFSNQPTQNYLIEVNEKTAKDIVRKWYPFYIVQFRLNEEKYGISFTGELRGLLANGNPPFISLALTKKFDLTKFMEFGK